MKSLFLIFVWMSRANSYEKESIVGRVIEFLKAFSPFDSIGDHHLWDIAEQARISYHEKDSRIFSPSDRLPEHLYVIRKGSVRIEDPHGQLVDQCSIGEIFGARALLDEGNYLATAIADPEALLIQLPAPVIRQVMSEERALLRFFFGGLHSGTTMRIRGSRVSSELEQQYAADDPAAFQHEFLTSFPEPISCSPDTPIITAASTMRRQRVGSIVIVSEEFHPIGIVTDTDLRNKVATGDHSLDTPISVIMSSPVKTVRIGVMVEEYLLEMILLGVHHLCITKEGGSQERLIGVVTDHDLLVSRGNNPAVLIKELKRRNTIEGRQQVVVRFDHYVRQLVQEDFPVTQTGQLMRGFNRALLSIVVDEALAHAEAEIQPDSFCFLALGSTARAEQIIRTDFDSAIVFRDGDPELKAKLEQMSQFVMEKLQNYGYKADKAGIQADNPQWIMPLSEWKQTFRRWIDVPDEHALLHATIFFDLMPFYGNAHLALELQEYLSQQYRGNQRYMAFLASNALRNPPPLGFFNNLLLERSGEHKDGFDIKARAMMPLADAARLKAMEWGCLFPSSTLSRYQRLAELDPLFADRYAESSQAYELFMTYRARQGFKFGNDGRFIDPSVLSSLEKQVLKKAFAPLAAIQHLIKPA